MSKGDESCGSQRAMKGLKMKQGAESHLSRLSSVQHLLKAPVVLVVGVSTRKPGRPSHEVRRELSYCCTCSLLTERHTHTHRLFITAAQLFMFTARHIVQATQYFVPLWSEENS